MDYSSVLILCAPATAPTKNCNAFLMAMREHGAKVQLSSATVDVALTRNCQAASAFKFIQDTPGAIDWVLWLDWDMSASIDSVNYMMLASHALADEAGLPSVSGSYCNRHKKNLELAAFALKGSWSRKVTISDITPESTIHAIAALTGMGCLLQPAKAFVQHCLEAEWFTYPKHPNKVPCVCQPHLTHASELGQWVELEPNDENLYWIAEDFDYCTRELDGGRLVYVVPVAFGHDKTEQLWPGEETVFPGLRPPSEVLP